MKMEAEKAKQQRKHDVNIVARLRVLPADALIDKFVDAWDAYKTRPRDPGTHADVPIDQGSARV